MYLDTDADQPTATLGTFLTLLVGCSIISVAIGVNPLFDARGAAVPVACGTETGL